MPAAPELGLPPAKLRVLHFQRLPVLVERSNDESDRRGGRGGRSWKSLLSGLVVAAIALVLAKPSFRGAMLPTAPDTVVNVVPTRAESHTTTTAPSPKPPEAVSSTGTAPSGGKSRDVAPSPKPVMAPAPGSAEIAEAETALTANRPANAVAAYEKAFAQSPELRDKNSTSYAKALIEDGKAHFDADADVAAERFQAAAKADPDSFDAHFFLAKLDTRRGDPQSAQREYLEAIRINPKSADAQFNLGFVYFSQKRYEDALRQYEQVVKLKPPYLADVFYNLSACYEQMKRKSDAIAALRRGLVAVPGSELLRQRLKQLGG
jgi:Tfp pilus assembly protein PilF